MSADGEKGGNSSRDRRLGQQFAAKKSERLATMSGPLPVERIAAISDRMVLFAWPYRSPLHTWHRYCVWSGGNRPVEADGRGALKGRLIGKGIGEQVVNSRLRSTEIPTASGVECHSSPGAKHRRRFTSELNARSRLHRPHRFHGGCHAGPFFAGCSTTSVLGAFRTGTW